MRRLGTLVCGSAAVLGGLVAAGVPALAGSAQTLDDAGWWWRVKQGPVAPVAPAPPTTSEDQLMVQGAPDGASAIAAVRFTLNEGDGSPILTLKVAPNGDSGGADAILIACQAGAAWTGGTGPQQWEASPLVDCSQSVQGQRSADGATWVFPVASLQFNDQINVVLVPGKNPTLPEGANASVFQLIFERPTATSISTTDGTASDDFGGGDFGGGFGTTGYDSTFPDPSFTDPAIGPSTFSTPPVQPALPPENVGTSAIAPRVQARTPVPTQAISNDRPGGARALGFLVLLLGGAGSWWFSQQAAPAPRKLGRFAGVPVAAGAAGGPPLPEAQVGGLGRFARTRSSAPRRLS